MFNKLGLSILFLIFSISLLADMRGTDSNGKPVVLRSDGTWSYLSQNNPEECNNYARRAISQQQTNLAWQCNYTDVAWHGDFKRHYNWCIKANKGTQGDQTKQRENALSSCATRTPARPQFLGCFVDKDERDIKGQFLSSPNMTTELCVTECRKLGFKVAATQYGKQCFCGNNYGSFGQASDSECVTPCAGNSQQNCGGGWRNSVYKIRPG